MEWYKKGSLCEGPSDRFLEAIEVAENPFSKRPYIKFEEAAAYRKRLQALTHSRLKTLRLMDDLSLYPEIAAFRTPHAGLTLLLILMRDFYAEVPTIRYKAVNEISGQAYRKTEQLIRNAAEDGALVIERNPNSKREHILFPTLMTVLTYELVLCPAYLEENEYILGGKKETLSMIYDFWEKRTDLLPEELAFELTERQQIAKLRIVS